MPAVRRAVVLAVLASFVPGCVGHGVLVVPPLRGGTAGTEKNAFCPQCGNGPGVCGDGGQWPNNSDYLGFVDGPKATFKAGEVAEFQVHINAHHKGHFEFRLCDQRLSHSTQDPLGCLAKHILKRASPPSDCVPNDRRGDCQPIHVAYPERWYLPPTAGLHSMRFKIPSDLQCAECTLVWAWWTANSCTPAKDYGCYYDQMKAQGWDAGAWCGAFCGTCGSSLVEANASSAAGWAAGGCGEQFRNCADITVLASGSNAAPTTTKSVTPAPAPTTTKPVAPTPAPAPACRPVGDCSMHSWCNMQRLTSLCASKGATCDSPFCKMSAEPEPEPEPEPQPTARRKV